MSKIKNRVNKDEVSKDYDEWLINSLKNNPEEQIEYLKASLEETDMPEVFLSALGYVAKAKGIRNISKMTGLNRESLYKMLTRNGNPEIKSLYAVLDALGLKLSVELKESA